MAAPTRSPYKFLDPYEYDDEQLFFGRDEEIKVLVADVVVNRLVVLFAPTGTGKTSLINAGVRPVLERRGYATFFVRVREDPVRSARAVLAKEAGRPLRAKVSFDRQLVGLARDLGTPTQSVKPIVLFFDQFEEFFLYVVSKKVAKAERFVASIARLLEDPTAPVHVAFSLREEFLGEMDFFREAIPTIFHADSNLRLRWFARAQAQAAIKGPVGGEVEPKLEQRLIADLAETGRSSGGSDERPIEPAQLQIVCDTIWRRSPEGKGRLTLEAYLGLGTPAHSGSVAQQILDLRLAEQLEVLEKTDVELLDRMLDKLRTDRGTKWVREVDELADGVGAGRTAVRALLRRLEGAGLVRVEPREGSELVELVHDYLAERERMDGLRRAVRTARPRRFLREARERDEPLGGDEIREAVAAAAELGLDRQDGDIVLRSALWHGLSVEPTLAVLEESGAPIWEVLADRIEHGDEAEAAAVVESLTSLARPEAAEILLAALGRPDLAGRVIGLLGYAENAMAVQLLARGLAGEGGPGGDAVRFEALKALARLTRPHVRPSIGKQARSAIRDFYAPRIADRETAGPALAELAAVESEVAVELAAQGIADAALRSEALRTLIALARSTRREVAGRALDYVRRTIGGALERGDLATEEVEALSLLPTVPTVEILAQIVADARLAEPGDRALERLTSASDPEVQAAAERALATRELRSAATPVVEPLPAPAPPPSATPPPIEAFESHFHLIARRIADGRVAPLVGAGAGVAARPPNASWAAGASFLPLGSELARELAAKFYYPTDEPPDIASVAQYIELTAGRAALHDELRRIFQTVAPPTAIHSVLARLPLRLIFETNYDDALEGALLAARRPFDALTYVASGSWTGRFRHDRPDGESVLIENPASYTAVDPRERLVVVKLNGRVSRHDQALDSFVITEDDLLEAALQRTKALPVLVVDAAVESSFLFLGSSLRDWSLRAFLKEISRAGMPLRSWAVMRNPASLDVEYWHQRDVEVLDIGLDAYADGLARTCGLLEDQTAHDSAPQAVQARTAARDRVLTRLRGLQAAKGETYDREKWYLGPELDRLGDAIATAGNDPEWRAAHERARHAILLGADPSQLEDCIRQLEQLC